jgi:hypothetical protein
MSSISALAKRLREYLPVLAKDEDVSIDIKEDVDKIFNQMKVICYGDVDFLVDEAAVIELSSDLQNVRILFHKLLGN